MASMQNTEAGGPGDVTAVRMPVSTRPLGFERCRVGILGAMYDSNFSSYFNREAFSDITIHYSDRVFHGHKIVLCTFSRWFRAAFDGEFGEANAREITLHDDNPDALEYMFRMAYAEPYRLPDAPLSDPLDKAHFYVKVYRAVDKYQTRDSFEIVSVFEKSIEQYLMRIVERKAYDLDDFCELVEQIYALSGEQGKDPVLNGLFWRLLCSRKVGMLEGHSSTTRQLLKETSERIIDFGSDIFIFMIDQAHYTDNRCMGIALQQCLQCSRCTRTWMESIETTVVPCPECAHFPNNGHSINKQACNCYGSNE